MNNYDFAKGLRYLYRKVERDYNIQLGIADKFALKRYLIETNTFPSIYSLLKGTRRFLVSRGFKSKELEKVIQEVEEHEKDMAKYWLERKGITFEQLSL